VRTTKARKKVKRKAALMSKTDDQIGHQVDLESEQSCREKQGRKHKLKATQEKTQDTRETQRRLKEKQEKEEGRESTETLPRHRPTTFMKKRKRKADRKTQQTDSHTQTVFGASRLRAKFELSKGV